MKKYLIILSAAVLALHSCDKTESDVIDPEGEAPVFTAYSSPTKTVLSGVNISWSAEDAISVFNGDNGGNGYGNARYAASNIVGNKADFTLSARASSTDLTAASDVTDYVALYPYRGVETCSYDPVTKIITTELPSSQYYVAGSFDNNLFPMVAVSTTPSLHFSGVCGVLRLQLKGDATISSIAVKGTKISGKGTIDASSSAPVMTMSADATDDIMYVCGDGVALNSSTATDFHIVLPAATYASLAFTITDSERNSEILTANNLTISRNTVTPASLVYSATRTATDLSAAGLANCYVVNKGGNYCFAAKQPDGTAVSGAVKAKWIWATSGTWNSAGEIGNFIAGGSTDLIGGKLYFTVPESHQYGNVLIGVVDSSDKVLYSWHLWFTRPLADVTVAGHAIMDRNLGANTVYDAESGTDNNGSRGLFFQWGRKEPIPGSRTNAAESSAEKAFTPGLTTYCIYNTGFGPWKSDALAVQATNSVEASAYPVLMINSASKMPYVVSGNKDPWNAAANPCPYGYHVIKRTEFAAILAKTMVLKVSTEVDASDVPVNAHLLVDGKLTLPRVGFRHYQGYLSHMNTYGAYWTSEASAYNKAYYYRIQDTPNETNTARSYGSVVRCVAD